MWILPELVVKGARRLHELAEASNPAGEHTAILNAVKQLGFYTDCCDQGYWLEPARMIDAADFARPIILIAEILARQDTVTTREIELSVEHVGPAWRTPDMPHAVMRWAMAMHAEGLGSLSPEEYARMIFGDIDGGA